jgi:isocitrate dehydrogenase (NAD+)
MLRHLNENTAADLLENAVADVIREGRQVTYDMKANRDDPSAVGTREMAQAIVDRMKKAKPR